VYVVIQVMLIIMGLGLGSFTNALVWRVREQSLHTGKKSADTDLSIVSGRSMCVHCKHQLSSLDLLPVVSWLLLRGKCRYCKKSISWQYPIVELFTVILFLASYQFWPRGLTTLAEVVNFSAWLFILTGLIALLVYDLRWMLLPNRIIFPLYGIAVFYIISLAFVRGDVTTVSSAIVGILVGGGIFYILFILSGGRWVGGGDVKLGFLLGALAGSFITASLMLFLASLLGTLFVLPAMLSGKMGKTARIPFGPFLIIATYIVVLFGQQIVSWYLRVFVPV